MHGAHARGIPKGNRCTRQLREALFELQAVADAWGSCEKHSEGQRAEPGPCGAGLQHLYG